MRKIEKIALISIGVFALAAWVYAQATAEGGRVFKDNTGTYSIYSADQALNSMADWYTMKRADSVGCVVATKYGTTARLKQIRNNSGSVQKIKLVFVNKIATADDTVTINLNSYESSGKLPAVKKIVEGAVVDSTLYFLQVK